MFGAVLADYEVKLKEQAEHSIETTNGKEQGKVSQNITGKETPFR